MPPNREVFSRVFPCEARSRYCVGPLRTPCMAVLLDIKNASKRYGDQVLLDDASATNDAAMWMPEWVLC